MPFRSGGEQSPLSARHMKKSSADSGPSTRNSSLTSGVLEMNPMPKQITDLKKELNHISRRGNVSRQTSLSSNDSKRSSAHTSFQWDVFKNNTFVYKDKSDACINTAVQFMKVVTVVLLFLAILLGLVVNRIVLLLVSSQVKQANNATCNIYSNPDVNQTEEVHYCIATPSDNKVLWDEATCIQNETWRHERTDYGIQACPLLALRWIWCLLLLIIIPYVVTIMRNIYTLCMKKEPKPRRDVFFVSLLMDSLYAFGICLLMFRVLPLVENVIMGIAVLNGLSSVPAVLLLLSQSYRIVKQWSSSGGQNNTPKRVVQDIFVTLLNLAAVACQIIPIVLWPIQADLNTEDLLWSWEVPVALVCVSAGWWENYLDPNWGSISKQQQEFYMKNPLTPRPEERFLVSLKNSKVWLTLLGNVWKTGLSIPVTMLLYHKEYPDVTDWFTFLYNPIERCSGSWHVDFSRVNNAETYDWILIIVIELVVSMTVYFMVRAAAKMRVQPATVGSAMFLVSPVVYASLYAACNTWEDKPCAFNGIVPNYIFFDCSGTNKPWLEYFTEDYNWMGVLLWISQVWITRHLWTPTTVRLAKSKEIFVQPLIDLVVLDPWLGHNRRRVGNEDAVSSSNFVVIPQPINTETPDFGDTQSHHDNNIIPMIYMCATMWHETKQEMIQILKSIFRFDIDHLERKVAQEEFGFTDPDFYNFEVHIFFDDAMTLVDEEKGFRAKSVNNFVHTLYEAVNEAAGEVRERMAVVEPIRYITPYGGRLEWKLPGGNVMVAHLKDKDQIRHKKRWSQVMYMYYFLGHRLYNQGHWTDPAKAQKVADNTFILALDGDVDFQPNAVRMLVDLMKKDEKTGAACGRIHPQGSGPMVWYQKFEYAIGHWMQKSTENVLGCVLCSPGCFSLFRGSALMDENVMRKYATIPTEAAHHIQFDQGEDRWLCTLLLQQGHKVEYCAASDALTFTPEGFNEFYNQRRRWMPSTMANIGNLLYTWRQVIQKNSNISLLFIVYQAVLMISGILGTGTIFLMIVGAFNVAVGTDPLFSFMFNLVPIFVFILVCYLCESNVQLFIAAILTIAYSILQMIVLVGVMVQIAEDGLRSPNAIFFLFVAGTFVLGAILHPLECMCIVHGLIYFLAIPSMYMLLMIYAMTNMHVISWGTREVQQTKSEKQIEEEKIAMEEAKKNKTSRLQSLLGFGKTNKNEQGFTISLGNLWRCICCPTSAKTKQDLQFQMMMEKMEKMEEKLVSLAEKDISTFNTLQERSSFQDEESQASLCDCKSELGFKENENKLSANDTPLTMKNKWIANDDPKLGKGPVEEIDAVEKQFFEELVEKYLYPLVKNKVEEEQSEMALKALRNKMSGTYLLLNTIFVATIYTLQSHTDTIHIKWPYKDTKGDDLFLEPLGLLFLGFYGLIMAIQVIGMISHRATTFFHILSTTLLPIENKFDAQATMAQETMGLIMQAIHDERSGSITPKSYEKDVNEAPGMLVRRGTVYNLVKQPSEPGKQEEPKTTDLHDSMRRRINALKKDLDLAKKPEDVKAFKKTNMNRRQSLAVSKLKRTVSKKSAMSSSQSCVSLPVTPRLRPVSWNSVHALTDFTTVSIAGTDDGCSDIKENAAENELDDCEQRETTFGEPTELTTRRESCVGDLSGRRGSNMSTTTITSSSGLDVRRGSNMSATTILSSSGDIYDIPDNASMDLLVENVFATATGTPECTKQRDSSHENVAYSSDSD